MRSFSKELEFYDDFAQTYDLEYENRTQDLSFWLEWTRGVDKVLEIAVGTGRVATLLIKHGVKVVGIDISEEMLLATKEKIRLLQTSVRGNIELFCADMREFDLKQKFPLVIVPFSAFQHMLTNEDVRRALCCFREHLEVEGKLIIDCFNPDLTSLAGRSQKEKASHRITRLKDNQWFLSTDIGKYDPVKQLLSVTLISDFSGQGGSIVRRYIRKIDLRVFFPQELVSLVENEGFRVLNVLGDFDQSVISEQSQRIIVFGQKA